MDLMTRRRALLARTGTAPEPILPAEYQQVEYLENTGTQYIQTNYVPVINGLSCEFEYMMIGSQGGDKMMFGCAGSGARVYAERYGNRAWYAGIGTNGYSNVLTTAGNYVGIKYKLTMDKDLLIVDGTSIQPNNTFQTSSLTALCLFAWNRDGTIGFINDGLRIYFLAFRNGDTLSACFIPCYRKQDAEPGVYDLISNTFYTNAGTGQFVVGADVN